MEEVLVVGEVVLGVESPTEIFRQVADKRERKLAIKQDELEGVKSDLEQARTQITTLANLLSERVRELNAVRWHLVVANDKLGKKMGLSGTSIGIQVGSDDIPDSTTERGQMSEGEIELIQRELNLAREKIAELELKLNARSGEIPEESSTSFPPTSPPVAVISVTPPDTPQKVDALRSSFKAALDKCRVSVATPTPAVGSNNDTCNMGVAASKLEDHPPPQYISIAPREAPSAIPMETEATDGTNDRPVSSEEVAKIPIPAPKPARTRVGESPRSSLSSKRTGVENSTTTSSKPQKLFCKKCGRRFLDQAALKIHNVMFSLTDRCASPPRESSSVNSAGKLVPGTRSTITVTAELRNVKCKCNICGKMFSAQSQLNMHIKKRHSPAVEIKDMKRNANVKDTKGEEEHGFSKYFSSQAQECGEVGSDLAGARWMCKCSKRFHLETDLRGHIAFMKRVHAHKCTKCPRRFCWRSDLKAHMSSVHGKMTG